MLAVLPPTAAASASRTVFTKERRATMATAPASAPAGPSATLPTANDIAQQLLASLGGGPSASAVTDAQPLKITPAAYPSPPRTEATRTRRALTSATPKLETVWDEHGDAEPLSPGAAPAASQTAPAPAVEVTTDTRLPAGSIVLLRVLVKQNSSGVATFEVCSTHTAVLKSLFAADSCPFRIVHVPSTAAERSIDISHRLNTRYLPAVEDRFLITLSPAKLKEVEDADPYGLGKRRVLVKPYAVSEFIHRAGFKLLGSHCEGYANGAIQDIHTFIQVQKRSKGRKKVASK